MRLMRRASFDSPCSPFLPLTMYRNSNGRNHADHRCPGAPHPHSLRRRGRELQAGRLVNLGAGNRHGRGLHRCRHHRLGRCLCLCLPANHLYRHRGNDCAAGARAWRCPTRPAFPPSWNRSSATCICSAAMASPCLRSRRSISRCGILPRKAKGVPLHRLIGEAKRARIPAYASLLRIGKPDLIAGECETALRQGYKAIKLHETTTPAVFAARQAIGPGIPLMVDMNCPLNGEAAIAFAHSCRDAAPLFLEEPVWPPEDFATLAEVRTKGGLNIAAGENACTVHQFRQMMTGRRGKPRAALRDQGRRHHRISEGRRTGRRTRRPARAAFALFRAGLAGDAATAVAARRRKLRRDVLHEARRHACGAAASRSTPTAMSRSRRGPGSAMNRTRTSWSNTACRDAGRRLLRAFLRRRGILCRGAASFAAGVAAFFASSPPCSAPPASRYHLLQANDRALQRLDLPVGGVDLLLMIRRQLGDRLLQEVDIALQAGGAPLHGLFDGADFDAGNVLRMNGRRRCPVSSAKRRR